MHSPPPEKPDSLADVFNSLLGGSSVGNRELAGLQFGPGCAYLVDASSNKVVYLEQKDNEALPSSLYELIAQGTSFEALIHPDDREGYDHALSRLTKNELSSPFEYRISTEKSAKWLAILDYRTPINDAEGTIIGYIGKIIEDHKKSQALEHRTRETQQELSAAAIRRFLHDFNNTIAGIYSLSELYSMPGSEMSSMLEGMGHICKSSTRAQKITQKIKEIVIPRETSATYHELEQLLKDSEEYILALLPKGTEFTINSEASSLPVHLDSLLFRQAMMHIASNSGAACHKNVHVTINCTSTTHGENKKPAARIDFIDNGSGINAENLGKALLPNFTTKDPETHHGIGLNLVKQFTEEHGGTLEIESAPDQGTTVSLLIPLVDLSETLSSVTETSHQTAATPQDASRTVLIYTWEDISRHPLLEQLRDNKWKYRIHLDPFQLMLDIKELGDEIDGIIIFLSDLDDKAAPLVQDLKQLEKSSKIALIAMAGKIDSWPSDLREGCGFEASSDAKPSALSKKLTKYFSP